MNRCSCGGRGFRLMVLIPWLRKMASKARLNFASRSWIRNRGGSPRSSRSIGRLRACCSIHGPSGLLVHATYSIRRLPNANEDKHVQSAQQDGVDGEEVAGERRRAVLAQKGAPIRLATLRRRRDARAPEDVANQCRGDVDPELAQLADDPQVAPVVCSRAPAEGSGAARRRRSAVDRGASAGTRSS
jgi:hypothetical protein